jgi:hypothetical protein
MLSLEQIYLQQKPTPERKIATTIGFVIGRKYFPFMRWLIHSGKHPKV